MKLLFLALLRAYIAQNALPNPVADPAAIVVVGATRVTLLTAAMIRVETRSARSPAFDDRATLQAVNRYLPVPSFTVAPINATAATITTAALTITVVDDGGAPPDACASPRAGFDVSNPRRSPAYPNGLNDTTQATCCAACNSDALCTAFVFNSAPGARGNNCWPLSGYGALVPAADRLTGGATGGASVTVSFKGPGGSTVTWAPGAGDPANLNGTYSALDCYSTPMECNAEYYGRMGGGLLSTAGWAALDDTRTARLVAAPNNPAGLPVWWDLGSMPLLDVYFHAHPQLDFKAALADWVSVLGRPEMLPRSAFGVWWSRYYECGCAPRKMNQRAEPTNTRPNSQP